MLLHSCRRCSLARALRRAREAHLSSFVLRYPYTDRFADSLNSIESSQANPLDHHSPPDPRPFGGDSFSSSSHPFGDSSAAETSPYIFDQFGVVTDRDANGAHPLLSGFGADDGNQPPQAEELAQRQEDALEGFSGNSWMDVTTLGNLWDNNSADQQRENGGDLWMS